MQEKAMEGGSLSKENCEFNKEPNRIDLPTGKLELIELSNRKLSGAFPKPKEEEKFHQCHGLRSKRRQMQWIYRLQASRLNWPIFWWTTKSCPLQISTWRSFFSSQHIRNEWKFHVLCRNSQTFYYSSCRRWRSSISTVPFDGAFNCDEKNAIHSTSWQSHRLHV